jgi:hypothetical protein
VSCAVRIDQPPGRYVIKLSKEDKGQISKKESKIRKHKSTAVEANDQAKLTTQNKTDVMNAHAMPDQMAIIRCNAAPAI